jgi:hypothetical protein
MLPAFRAVHLLGVAMFCSASALAADTSLTHGSPVSLEVKRFHLADTTVTTAWAPASPTTVADTEAAINTQLALLSKDSAGATHALAVDELTNASLVVGTPAARTSSGGEVDYSWQFALQSDHVFGEPTVVSGEVAIEAFETQSDVFPKPVVKLPIKLTLPSGSAYIAPLDVGSKRFVVVLRSLTP